MWQPQRVADVRGRFSKSMEDFADEVLPEFGGLGGWGVVAGIVAARGPDLSAAA